MYVRTFALAALTTALISAPGHLVAPARAATSQLSLMQDDDELLHRGEARREHALKTMKAAGVDIVRVTVLWRDIAPSRPITRGVRRFRAQDPSAYPRSKWDNYDALVSDAARLGVHLFFNVTGPGPAWAHARPPRSQRRFAASWRPKAGEFYRFAMAVGKRYSGSYRDENTKIILPRVALWSIWNEPNQGGWLTPQREKVRGRWVPRSPLMYRRLYAAGRAGLVAGGHGHDYFLLGETAPNGSRPRDASSAVSAGEFYREMFCLDPSLHTFRGRSAKARGCTHPSRLPRVLASAVGHHPYTKTVAPNARAAGEGPGSFTTRNLSSFASYLDAVSAASHGALGARLPIWVTEFGWQTSPPDPYFGVSLAKQAEWINEAEYMSYLNPRVVAHAQFLLRDSIPRPGVKGRAAYSTYQSGLLYQNGRPKPSFGAYMLPLIAHPHSDGTVAVWGMLRFLPNGTAANVAIEADAGTGAGFQELGTLAADPSLGVFSHPAIAVPAGARLRAAYHSPDGYVVYSRVVDL